MKKILSVIIAFIMLLTAVPVWAVDADNYKITFNGVYTESDGVIYDDTIYVPLRKVFESMGAEVFYRSRDKMILALSRDGDMIYHVVGSNKVDFNGVGKVFEHPSVLLNDGTYIPLEMLEETLYPDRILYDYGQMNIQKYLFDSDYNKAIEDVLDVSESREFYPEKFTRYISYHIKKPDYSMQNVIYTVNMGLDYPFYQGVAVVENPYNPLVLVNKYNHLPAGFERENLVGVSKEHKTNDGRYYWLEAETYEQYIKMWNAAKLEGLSMEIVSAYRTEQYQRTLYDNRLTINGKVYADNYTARPGASEHQTGLAVDVGNSKGVFEYTNEFKWLQQHAHEYGFILRYPKGKEWITGYSYEPWHYRYVGVDAARTIQQEGITYEEYYVKYVGVSEFE